MQFMYSVAPETTLTMAFPEEKNQRAGAEAVVKKLRPFSLERDGLSQVFLGLGSPEERMYYSEWTLVG